MVVHVKHKLFLQLKGSYDKNEGEQSSIKSVKKKSFINKLVIKSDS